MTNQVQLPASSSGSRPPQPQADRCTFSLLLSLPAELRLEIYEWLFLSCEAADRHSGWQLRREWEKVPRELDSPRVRYSPVYGPVVALAQTCRQLSAEVAGLRGLRIPMHVALGCAPVQALEFLGPAGAPTPAWWTGRRLRGYVQEVQWTLKYDFQGPPPGPATDTYFVWNDVWTRLNKLAPKLRYVNVRGLIRPE